jgi:hypothetical protein
MPNANQPIANSPNVGSVGVADLHLAGGTLGLYRTDFVSESGTCMPTLSRRQR